MTSLAFVTPTFGPDRARCELLVRSLDEYAPEIHHYLIVDSFEAASFRHLASRRTTILPAEDVIGIKQLRLPLRQNFWLHHRTLPMRGWIRQQILKMAAVTALDQEIVTCIDSDVAFVRPFKASTLLEGGKFGLLDVDYTDAMVEKWTAVSESLLGLPPSSAEKRGYVGHLITWSRRHVLELQQHLQKQSGRPWQVTVGRCRTFSEYNLYGTFIREVIGYDQSDHSPSTKALVRQPWNFDLSTEAGLSNFIGKPDPDNVAVMVHSKHGIPLPLIDKCLWAAGRR